MPTTPTEERTGRETRLLVLVVAVSLTVLLLLARFRFPAADLTVVPPAPAPLAGLAARATFDEITATIRDAISRVTPAVVMLPLQPASPAEPEQAASSSRRPQPAPDPAEAPAPVQPQRYMPALRIKNDVALVHIPAGLEPALLPDLKAAPQIVGSDPGREIAVVRVPPGPSIDTLPGGLRISGELTFALLVDATSQGPTAHPAFIGRGNAVAVPGWPQRLTAVSGAEFSPGALVFSLEGSFLGIVVRNGESTAVAPATALEPFIAQLAPQDKQDKVE
jgi:hypothetical protein